MPIAKPDSRMDEKHSRRLTNAAEGWLFLATQLRRLEKSLGHDGGEKTL